MWPCTLHVCERHRSSLLNHRLECCSPDAECKSPGGVLRVSGRDSRCDRDRQGYRSPLPPLLRSSQAHHSSRLNQYVLHRTTGDLHAWLCTADVPASPIIFGALFVYKNEETITINVSSVPHPLKNTSLIIVIIRVLRHGAERHDVGRGPPKQICNVYSSRQQLLMLFRSTHLGWLFRHVTASQQHLAAHDALPEVAYHCQHHASAAIIITSREHLPSTVFLTCRLPIR